ncbi:MAG TPA: C25 family cysteine peptidase [Phycisphaerae bacterium]|nr:C25 family cysteine peptidase [Phycisphaerae bacterium]
MWSMGSRRVTLAVLAVAFASLPVIGAGPVTVTVLENTPDKIVVDYQIGIHQQTVVTIDGQPYTVLSLPHEPVMLERGAPELPKVCRSIIVGPDAAMEASVVASEYYDITDIKVAPSKGNISRQIDPATVPYTFGPEYSANAFYPGQLVGLQAPYIMRDFRGQVLELFPFQYNPGTETLRVYTHVRVEVARRGVSTENVQTPRRDRQVCAAFHQLYKHHFINYVPETRSDPLEEQGSMLVICYDQWLPNIQPFVDHKNDILIETTAVGVSTIGTTSSQIAAYIQNVYNTTDLAFVLLVGDVAQIPSPGPGARDPIYSRVDGSDNYPDIMIGRFSAENAAQVDLQVLKSIQYEDEQYTTTDWFWKAVGIASSEGSGIGDDGQSDWVHMDEIRGWLTDYGYTAVDQIYQTTGATDAMVAAAVNEGRGLINYCGHGGMTYWVTTGFDISDVNALTNYNKLPVIISVACNNGEFQSGTCFAEAWLRATRDGQPTGAAAMYASTISMSWAPPMEGQDEFNLLFTSEAYFAFGTLCFAGSCSMMDEYGSSGVNEFECWTVFGDPSLRIVGVAYVPPLRMALASELPEYIAPEVATTIRVSIEPGTETLVADSPTLHYSYGADFASVPMVNVEGALWEGTLPPPACGTRPVYYFTAQGNLGTLVQLPTLEDGGTYTASVGNVSVLLDDDFENERGWTVFNDPSLTGGGWERVVPLAGGGATVPVADYDGSGRCYITDNRYSSDVDFGPTILTSPVLDAGNGGDLILKFARWLTCDDELPPAMDYLDVEVSNDGGASWTRMQRLRPAEDWANEVLHLGDFVPLTDEMQVRFSIRDIPNNSLTEAGIDAVQVVNVYCLVEARPGDLNCDDAINAFDIDPFVLALTSPTEYAAAFPACNINNADINGDGEINVFDVDPFVDLLVQ